MQAMNTAPTRVADSPPVALGSDRGETLRVGEWRRESVGGSDVRSAYVERYWLPILGPTSIMLLRCVANTLDASGGIAVTLSTGALASQIGLGNEPGSIGVLRRCFRRLEQFGFVIVGTEQEHKFRLVAPCLARRQIVRLPPHLQTLHATEVATLNAERQPDTPLGQALGEVLGLVHRRDVLAQISSIGKVPA